MKPKSPHMYQREEAWSGWTLLKINFALECILILYPLHLFTNKKQVLIQVGYFDWKLPFFHVIIISLYF
jgi:hypothetical protein